MFTVGIIRNGANYLSYHLRKNDYWAEGEKAVLGEWIGEGAKALGLSGEVSDKPFEALRQNRNPITGEALTARDHANRVAFFDIQLSAPKDVSVLAMVGGDDRERVLDQSEQRMIAFVKWKVARTEIGLPVLQRANVFHGWHFAMIACDFLKQKKTCDGVEMRF